MLVWHSCQRCYPLEIKIILLLLLLCSVVMTVLEVLNELLHDKTKKMTCASSLVRVFAVRMKKH